MLVHRHRISIACRLFCFVYWLFSVGLFILTGTIQERHSSVIIREQSLYFWFTQCFCDRGLVERARQNKIQWLPVRSLPGPQRKASFCSASLSEVSWLWFLIPSPERLPKYSMEHTGLSSATWKGDAAWLLSVAGAVVKGRSKSTARKHQSWRWPWGFRGSAGGCPASPTTCQGQLPPSLGVSPSLCLEQQALGEVIWKGYSKMSGRNP